MFRPMFFRFRDFNLNLFEIQNLPAVGAASVAASSAAGLFGEATASITRAFSEATLCVTKTTYHFISCATILFLSAGDALILNARRVTNSKYAGCD